MKALLCLYFQVAICYYNNIPPDPSAINDTRPRLVLNLNGFNPGSRVYLRFWESNIAFSYPANYQLYIDASGRLQTEVVLSKNTTSADVLIYVDQTADGKLDTADFGTYQNGIVITTPSYSENLYTYLLVNYRGSTLSEYTSTAALPVTGQAVCVYMPSDKPSWDSSLVTSMPAFPVMTDAALTLSDWFPVSVLSTTGVTQRVPLITNLGTGGYNETCVYDTNSSGNYDSGEAVITTLAP